MDSRLISELYRKYSKEILLYVYSMSSNWQVAEDITQEVFVKAILSLPDNHTNFRNWLYIVARNTYFNFFKHNKVGQSVEQQIERDYRPEISSLDQIIEDERKRILYECISQLEDRYRQVLLLQYFEGLSQKDIAEILQISLENVRVLVFRAKKKLKEQMEYYK